MGRLVPLLLVCLMLPSLAPAATAEGPTETRIVAFEVGTASMGLIDGARIVERFDFAGLALVAAPASTWARIAALPNVAGVYQEEALTLHLDRVRGIVNANPPSRESDWPTGSGIGIAVVDSGIDEKHPDFANRVAATIRIGRSGGASAGNGDDDGHGTHVAGILAGSGARSSGGRLHGIAPGASLVGVDISEAFTTTSAVRAFAWIHDNRETYNIRVVSNSWGREKAAAFYDADDPVIRASDALVADGLVVVFSAGNRGRDGDSTLTPEAMNPNVITVGSASAQGRAESYSSRGPATDKTGATLDWTKPDLVAPGSAVVSTRSSQLAPGNGVSEEEYYYTVMNGTSMAAPQVAAAAALLLDAHPDLAPAMVMAILQGTSRDLGRAGPDMQTGFGMLDVGGALHAAALMTEGSRRVVVEKRIPIHIEGSVTAASNAVVLLGGKVRVPPDQDVSYPVVVPANARDADLYFNWSGTGDFSVELQGDSATWRFQQRAPGRLELHANVPEGTYRLVAKTGGAATSSSFTVDGSILIIEEMIVEVPTEFHTRPFLAQGGFYLPATGMSRALTVVGQAPFLALALCGIVGAACGLRLRKK